MITQGFRHARTRREVSAKSSGTCTFIPSPTLSRLSRLEYCVCVLQSDSFPFGCRRHAHGRVSCDGARRLDVT